ncbi:MAG: hypothetical protein HKP25_00140 [Marinicaulis sp.]|nr:hypothetical protein [Marinicaulis sp.]
MLEKKHDPTVDTRLAKLTAKSAVEFKNVIPKRWRRASGFERGGVFAGNI